MEDRLWQTLAKPVSYGKTIRLINESGNFYKRRCPMPQNRIKANTFYNKDNSYFRKSVYPEEFPKSRTPAAVPPRIVRKRMYLKLRDAEEEMAVQALHEGAECNKRTGKNWIAPSGRRNLQIGSCCGWDLEIYLKSICHKPWSCEKKSKPAVGPMQVHTVKIKTGRYPRRQGKEIERSLKNPIYRP